MEEELAEAVGEDADADVDAVEDDEGGGVTVGIEVREEDMGVDVGVAEDGMEVVVGGGVKPP